jgi:hypothetical protein
VGKREGKIPLRDARSRTGNNTDMELTATRQKGGTEHIRLRPQTGGRFLYKRLARIVGNFWTT